MSALWLSLIAFVCIFGGAMAGMAVGGLLPRHHLSEESRDAVKLGAGMVATLAALVLGLFIASAKGTFDTIATELRQAGAKIVLLDRTLAHYGPEAAEARELLRGLVVHVIAMGWPENAHPAQTTETPKSQVRFQMMYNKLMALSPKGESQVWLRSRALQVNSELAEALFLLLEHRGQSSLPIPFVVMLILWLTIIFGAFGLLSPRNATVIAILLICSLSCAGALFLIEELDRPYEGIIRMSAAPLKNALSQLGR